MSIKREIYKLFEDNEGGSLSCARIVTWLCAFVGMVLLVLHFFGIGTNVDTAYVLLGVGVGGGTVKSITSQNKIVVEECEEEK